MNVSYGNISSTFVADNTQVFGWRLELTKHVDSSNSEADASELLGNLKKRNSSLMVRVCGNDLSNLSSEKTLLLRGVTK